MDQAAAQQLYLRHSKSAVKKCEDVFGRCVQRKETQGSRCIPKGISRVFRRCIGRKPSAQDEAGHILGEQAEMEFQLQDAMEHLRSATKLQPAPQLVAQLQQGRAREDALRFKLQVSSCT